MADEGGQHEAWLKLREAAGRLGVSERTLRRRIRGGSAQGRQVSTPFGTAWEVLVDGAAPAAGLPTTPGGRTNGHADPALMEALRMLERRDQTILELAGRCGYLQAELSQAREQLALVGPCGESLARENASPAAEPNGTEQHANGVSGVGAIEPEPKDERAESNSPDASLIPRGPWGRFLAWLYG